MVTQRDYSGQISCRNRSVTDDIYSKDWCNKKNDYCCYDEKCRKPVLTDMKEFKKWRDAHSPGEMAYQTWEESWKAAMEKVLEFIKDIPYSSEEERRIVVALENRVEKELGQRDCA